MWPQDSDPFKRNDDTKYNLPDNMDEWTKADWNYYEHKFGKTAVRRAKLNYQLSNKSNWGKSEHKQVINSEDIINLKIALNTCKSINELCAQL